MLGGLEVVVAGTVAVGSVADGSWLLPLLWVTGNGWAAWDEALPFPHWFLELLGALAMGGHCEEAHSRAE